MSEARDRGRDLEVHGGATWVDAPARLVFLDDDDEALEGDEPGAFEGRVRSIEGVEALGEGFSYELLLDYEGWPQPVDAESEDPSLVPMAALVGARAELRWGGGFARVGVVCELERLRAFVPDKSLEETVSTPRSTYRARLAPVLYPAALTARSRVHVDTTVDELFVGVGLAAGLARDELRVACATPAARRAIAFSLQYEESDLAFLTRWCERFGVWLRYEDDGSVVLCDGPRFGGEPPTPRRTLVFDAATSLHATADSFYALSARRALRPRAVTVRLDDGHASKQLLRYTAEVAGGHLGETVRYEPPVGPASDLSARVGAELAAQRLAVEALSYRGHARARGLAAGDLVRLEGARESALDGAYQLTRVRVSLVQRSTPLPQAELFGDALTPAVAAAPRFRVEFDAVPAATPFRPALRTPAPRVDGVLVGVIAGDEQYNVAPVDAQGRYRVRLPLHADATAPPGGALLGTAPSVPLLMPTGGSSRGMHLPLRTGTRVAVAFLRGDPDRPVLLGALPTGAASSPVQTANGSAGLLWSSGALIEVELEDDA